MNHEDRMKREGEEIIERTAKKLISMGYQCVTSNISSFYYIFGKTELDRLLKYSFDYVYLLDDGKKTHRRFDERVHRLSDIISHAVLKEYNKSRFKGKRDFEIVYPEGKDLEELVKWQKIKL